MSRLSRRNTVRLIGSAALAPALIRSARAQEKLLTIGMSFPLTGTLALQAGQARDAIVYAIDEANEKGSVAGYKLRTLILDDASPTTGQYDPAQAATNARKMVNDPSVVAAVGPLNSGSAKAMCPIFSQAGMATISGSATNPDLNDPKFAQIYRPAGSADLLPHGDHRRLSGSQLCQLRRRGAEARRRSWCWTMAVRTASAWRMHSRPRPRRRA